MLTVNYYIESNNKLIAKYDQEISKIEQGVFGYDGTMPKVCVKPMYEAKIARMIEANEYLKGFDPEHILTDDEQYHYRLIINGTPHF